MEKIRKTMLSEFSRYLIVCLVCFGVDFSLLILLTESLGLHYLLAGLLGILCGNLLNYLLSTRWVFSRHQLENKGKELGVFLIFGLGAIPIHHVVLWASTDLVHIHYQVSKLIAVGTTFLLIFFLRKFYLF